MSSDPMRIRVERLSKRYEIYDTPRDRLKQLLLPPLRDALGLSPRQYHSEFWALRDVSFEVRAGEAVGILGRNGSGKSTLLQMICGTMTPTQGRVQTHGRIGALLELGAGFNGDFTGRENVMLSGVLLGLEPEEVEARFDQIAAFADIGPFMEHAVKTYSSGMYVRLAFAVQACVEPAILVVDEALAVGDEKFQRKCYAHIDALRERGTAILLVTHSTATIEKYCDRALLLNRGELHGIGPANQIVDQYHALLYSDEQAYLRYLNSMLAADAGDAAGHAAVAHGAVNAAGTQVGASRGVALQVGSSQAGSSQAGSSQAGSSQAGSSQTGAPRIGAAQTGVTQAVASQAVASQGEVSQGEASQAGLAQTGPSPAESSAAAVISGCSLLGDDEQPRELFRVGERARVAVTIELLQAVRELQVGLLIRTVEGVTAFGTSTAYHDANHADGRAGQRLRVVFDLQLYLCAGPYFVTAAVAEPLGGDDMRYLDRRTDVALFRIQETAVKATGIASLPVRIETDCRAADAAALESPAAKVAA
ncbi:MAG: ABC transporter ATP-binding protein [Burkholderiaceae bacterium]